MDNQPNNNEEQKSYLERRRDEKIYGKKPVNKKTYYIPKKSAKRLAEEAVAKEAGTEKPTDAYFDYHMKNSKPICMNCGLEAKWLLQEKYSFLWRSCQAHVLPKKNNIGGFPSIGANFLNHLVLFPRFANLCGCHDQYDSSYEKMATMKVFPMAIDIIKRLYPFIAPDERKYLPDIIIQEIKPEIYNS